MTISSDTEISARKRQTEPMMALVRPRNPNTARTRKRQLWGRFQYRIPANWITLLASYSYRKFKVKKDHKIQYESSFEQMASDGEAEENLKCPTQTEEIHKKPQEVEVVPKRKVKSKLNL